MGIHDIEVHLKFEYRHKYLQTRTAVMTAAIVHEYVAFRLPVPDGGSSWRRILVRARIEPTDARDLRDG